MNLPVDCKLMCYKVGSHAVASIPLIPFPCVFRKYEVGNALSQKLEVGNGVSVRPMAL